MVHVSHYARKTWRPLAAIALVIGLAGPALAANPAQAKGTLPATAAAAPEDTIYFHEFDLDFSGQQWQQTDALLTRLGLPAATTSLQEESLNEGSDNHDFTAADFAALTGGEAAVIVTQRAADLFIAYQMAEMAKDDGDAAVATPVADGEGYGIAAVLQPSDVMAAWVYIERQVNAEAKEHGRDVEAASGPDQDMIWSTGGEEDSDYPSDDLADVMGAQGAEHIAVGRVNDFIIVTKTLPDLEHFMAVTSGSEPSLMGSEDATAIAAALPEDSLSFAYVNSQSIVQGLDAETKETLAALMPPDMPIEAMGGYAGFTLAAADNGFRVDSFGTLAEGVDPALVFAPNDPAIASAAGEAPADTFVFSAGSLPPNTFASAAFGLAQAINGSMADEMGDDDAMHALPTREEMDAEIAAANEKVGFDLQADLFDLLGNEYRFFVNFPAFGGSTLGIDGVAAISTTDPAALATTLEKVVGLIEKDAPDASIAVQTDGGNTLYEISDPEDTSVPSVSFGIVGDQAAVGVGNGIEQLTTPQSPSLADDEQFQSVMSTLPTDYYEVFYVDLSKLAPMMSMMMGGLEASMEGDESGGTPVASAGSLENLRALGAVAFTDGNSSGGTALLYIAGGGE